MQKTGGFARNWPPAHAKFACNWPPVAYKLYPSGRQLHINCTRVAASRMKTVHEPPVACNMNTVGRNLHATGSHVGTRQEASRQRYVKGHLYIIIIFFYHWQVHILDHASDYSADGPWIFGLENALVLWLAKPHGSKFCTH